MRLDDLDEEERERIGAWCEWAEEWSRRSDPTLNTSRIHGLDDQHDQYAYPRPGADWR